MLKLEADAASVLKDGLGKVREAVTEFANTKADRSDLDALRQQVDELEKKGQS